MEVRGCLCCEDFRVILEDTPGESEQASYRCCRGVVHVKTATLFAGISALLLSVFSTGCLLLGVYTVNFWLDVVLIILNTIVAIVLLVGLHKENAKLLLPFIVCEIAQCVLFFILACYTLYFTIVSDQAPLRKFDQMLMVVSIYIGIFIAGSAIWAAAKCYHYLTEKDAARLLQREKGYAPWLTPFPLHARPLPDTEYPYCPGYPLYPQYPQTQEPRPPPVPASPYHPPTPPSRRTSQDLADESDRMRFNMDSIMTILKAPKMRIERTQEEPHKKRVVFDTRMVRSDYLQKSGEEDESGEGKEGKRRVSTTRRHYFPNLYTGEELYEEKGHNNKRRRSSTGDPRASQEHSGRAAPLPVSPILSRSYPAANPRDLLEPKRVDEVRECPPAKPPIIWRSPGATTSRSQRRSQGPLSPRAELDRMRDPRRSLPQQRRSLDPRLMGDQNLEKVEDILALYEPNKKCTQAVASSRVAGNVVAATPGRTKRKDGTLLLDQNAKMILASPNGSVRKAARADSPPSRYDSAEGPMEGAAMGGPRSELRVRPMVRPEDRNGYRTRFEDKWIRKEYEESNDQRKKIEVKNSLPSGAMTSSGRFQGFPRSLDPSPVRNIRDPLNREQKCPSPYSNLYSNPTTSSIQPPYTPSQLTQSLYERNSARSSPFFPSSTHFAHSMYEPRY